MVVLRHKLRCRVVVFGVVTAFACSVSALSGCASRVRPEYVGPAQSGHGVEGEVVVHGQRVKGELLDVSDTAFVLQTRAGIVLVPKFTIDESSFRGLDLYRGSELAGAVLEQHRLLSRFPAGMPAAVLQSLLRQAGQREVKIITE
jgi:hypothetical protein